MAGVTGLIVAIGVTADSFIVYFERIRDEVRDGRPLVAAVETGWKRARRTIIAADGVNFIAAGVLYFLASSNVRDSPSCINRFRVLRPQSGDVRTLLRVAGPPF